MRTALYLTILLMLTSLSGLMHVQAEVPTNGDTVEITEDEIWNESTTMNGELYIQNNSTLTISSTLTVANNNVITVDEGSTLAILGTLKGDDINSGLRLKNSTQLQMNFGDLAETGELRFNFDHTIPDSAMFNVTIGDQTVDASGKDHIFIDVSLNGTDLFADFDIYYVFPVQILSIQALHSGGGNFPLISAHEINHTNGSLEWSNASFTLNIQGTLIVDNATVYGADIQCSGMCAFEQSNLVGSAPIHVSNGTSIEVNASSILGSRTDEDIILHDLAQISYTNNTGTGGTTDQWIRLLSERLIQTNSPNITVHQTGIGYGNTTRDDFTDALGMVDIGGSEWKRIVEWVGPNGQYNTENAELTLTLSSGWGDFTTTVPAPQIPQAVINLPLPFIEVVSIDAEDTTAEVDKKIWAMVTVRNTGAAPATVNIWCYVNGDLADTTSLTTTLAAGEEKKLPVSWWANTDGAQILNCKALIPDKLQSISEQITNLEGGESQEVGWFIGEETEDKPLVIYGILALIIIGASAMFSLRASTKDDSYGDVKEYSDTVENQMNEETAEEESSEDVSEVIEDADED